MTLNFKIALLILSFILMPQVFIAQVDFNKLPDTISANKENRYKESFFEALKQKGIENYDKAVKALLKCIELDNKEPAAYFELGKNYVFLKNYGKAEEALKIAVDLDENNQWYLDELYGVYIKTDDYKNSLRIVKKLIPYHPDYQHDLATLYFEHQKYRLALKTLDEMDESYGISKKRDALRNAIYNATGNDKERIEYLEERIAQRPNIESNYLNLIYRYSEMGDGENAFRIAKKLISQNPKSQLAHVALYKFYLDRGETEKAVNSMKIVVKSTSIKADIKTKVLNDFVRFVKDNPEYENDLLQATNDAIKDSSDQSYAELGEFYLQKNDKNKALEQFQFALKKDSNNFELIKKILLLHIDLKQYEQAKAISSETLELYPTQAVIYLINGVANNKLNQPKKAIESLETGIDFVIDNVIMKIDFYRQLSIAYKLDNNIPESNSFSKKADALMNKQ